MTKTKKNEGDRARSGKSGSSEGKTDFKGSAKKCDSSNNETPVGTRKSLRIQNRKPSTSAKWSPSTPERKSAKKSVKTSKPKDAGGNKANKDSSVLSGTPVSAKPSSSKRLSFQKIEVTAAAVPKKEKKGKGTTKASQKPANKRPAILNLQKLRTKDVSVSGRNDKNLKPMGIADNKRKIITDESNQGGQVGNMSWPKRARYSDNDQLASSSCSGNTSSHAENSVQRRQRPRPPSIISGEELAILNPVLMHNLPEPTTAGSRNADDQLVVNGGPEQHRGVQEYIMEKYQHLPADQQIEVLVTDLVLERANAISLQACLNATNQAQAELLTMSIQHSREASQSQEEAEMERQRAQKAWEKADQIQLYNRAMENGTLQRQVMTKTSSKKNEGGRVRMSKSGSSNEKADLNGNGSAKKCDSSNNETPVGTRKSLRIQTRKPSTSAKWSPSPPERKSVKNSGKTPIPKSTGGNKAREDSSVSSGTPISEQPSSSKRLSFQKIEVTAAAVPKKEKKGKGTTKASQKPANKRPAILNLQKLRTKDVSVSGRNDKNLTTTGITENIIQRRQQPTPSSSRELAILNPVSMPNLPVPAIAGSRNADNQLVLYGGPEHQRAVQEYIMDQYQHLPVDQQIEVLVADLVLERANTASLQACLKATNQAQAELHAMSLQLSREASQSQEEAEMERQRAQKAWEKVDQLQIYNRAMKNGTLQRQ